jgi:tetratricopeptide (TPR) repeat protein
MRDAGRWGRIRAARGGLIGAMLLVAACARTAPGPGAEGDAAGPAPAATGQGAGGDAQRGLTLFRQGRLIDAEPILEAALRAAPEDRRLQEALGSIYALTDRPGEAETLLRRATEGTPSSFGAWFHLGRALADTGREEEALLAVREARRRDPRPLVGLIEEGRLLERLGRCDEAEPIARQAIAREAGRAEPHVILSGCLQERGALDEAAASLRQALAVDPHHLGALSRLVAVEMRRGNLEAAERAQASHREALARRRVDDRVRGPRRDGVAAFGRGEYDAALAAFLEVAAETPDDPQVHLHIGATLSALGRYDDALASLERSLDLDPRDARVHTEIGRLRALEGRHAEAFEALERAIGMNPDDPEPHYVRAGLHRQRGEEDLYRLEMQRFEELESRLGVDSPPDARPPGTD